MLHAHAQAHPTAVGQVYARAIEIDTVDMYYFYSSSAGIGSRGYASGILIGPAFATRQSWPTFTSTIAANTTFPRFGCSRYVFPSPIICLDGGVFVSFAPKPLPPPPFD